MKTGKTKSSLKVSKTKTAELKLSGVTVHDIPAHRVMGEPVGFVPKITYGIYDKTFHPEDFVKHCQEGTTPTEIAALWGIARGTIGVWVTKHPEFQEAYLRGKTAHQAWFLRKYRNSLNDKTINPSLLIFAAKNQLGWSDNGADDFNDAPEEVQVDFNFTESEKGS